MNFAQPIWLLIGVVAGLFLAGLFRRFERGRVEALRHFAAGHLLEQLTASVSKRRRFLKRVFLWLALAFFFLALARPQWGFRWEEAKRRGIDVLFAVDVSRSMLARDVNPDRLTRAKLAVADLLEKLEGDRVGLIAFRGRAFLQSPFTLDYDAFRQSLEALDVDVIPTPGTDIASAIREAGAAFSLGSVNHKILVLITDGEDLAGNSLVAAKEAAKQEIKIFTVGVGTPAGEIIPITNENGGTDFVKDSKGQVVKSRLDESNLRQIAEITGGFYEPLGQRGEGLDEIYNQGLASIPKQELVARMKRNAIERYQWPLAAGILFLAIEMLLGERKRKFGIRNLESRKEKWEKGLSLLLQTWRGENSKLKGRPPVSFLIILNSSFLVLNSLLASPQSAEKFYRQGKYHEAYKEYKGAAERKPEKAKLNYNLGAAAYRDGNFLEAVSAFQKALQTSQQDLQQKAFYNLGNAQYRQGEPMEKTNPQQTLQLWRQALQSYAEALKQKKEDADAKFNYEFVKKKLKDLEKNQPQNGGGDKSDQPDPGQGPPGKGDRSDPSDKSDQKKSTGQGGEKNQPQNQNGPSGQKAQGKKGENQIPENKEGNGNSTGKGDSFNPSNLSGQPDSSHKKGEGKKGDEEMEASAAPGQMTPREARALLDSLKGDEKKIPLPQGEQGKGGGAEKETDKDW